MEESVEYAYHEFGFSLFDWLRVSDLSHLFDAFSLFRFDRVIFIEKVFLKRYLWNTSRWKWALHKKHTSILHLARWLYQCHIKARTIYFHQFESLLHWWRKEWNCPFLKKCFQKLRSNFCNWMSWDVHFHWYLQDLLWWSRRRYHVFYIISPKSWFPKYENFWSIDDQIEWKIWTDTYPKFHAGTT